MSYDDWLATDTVADQDEGIERMRLRLEEDERTQRWADFVAWLKEGRVPTLLRHVADLLDDRRDPYYVTPQQTILDFADAEGWPSVLNAITRAMKEQGA